MSDEIDPVAANEQYRECRQELRRLRRRVGEQAFDEVARFDETAVRDSVATHDEEIDGRLVVFVANDFGMPVAYRPSSLPIEAQNVVRERILDVKYDRDDGLNAIRKDLTDRTRIHKALVCSIGEESIDYHLPGAATGKTNFLTVREAVGLVDFCTNGSQTNTIVY